MKVDMTTTLSSALSGLQAGVNNAQKAAGEVAKLTTGSEGVQNAVRPLLNLQQSKQEVAINSEVVKTEGETLGRFVDEQA